jgi:CopZ-like zinc binding protein
MNPTCPVSRTSGRAVPHATLASLLHPQRFAGVEDQQWHFCESPDCDVVYFTAEGHTRSRADLSVRVGVKEREAPRPLCYCFGHTAASICDEVDRTGASTVVASVTARVKAGECSCEITNPSGRCCLGVLRREVVEAMRRAGVSGSSSKPPDAAATGDCCAVSEEGERSVQ